MKTVEAAYGPGVVPIPSRTSFYKLADVLATGRHTFGSAVTRRQSANRPKEMFTPGAAARPGEQVQIDSTPIDVMVLLGTGIAVRADPFRLWAGQRGLAIWERPPLVPSRTVDLGGYFLTS